MRVHRRAAYCERMVIPVTELLDVFQNCDLHLVLFSDQGEKIQENSITYIMLLDRVQPMKQNIPLLFTDVMTVMTCQPLSCLDIVPCSGFIVTEKIKNHCHLINMSFPGSSRVHKLDS